jgi:hypothetical protein
MWCDYNLLFQNWPSNYSTFLIVSKILDILRQARSWSGLDMFGGGRDGGDIIDETDEYIYGLPTVDFVRGRANIVDRRLTVYHAALSACADLKNTSVSF